MESNFSFLQSALNNLEEMRSGRESGYRDRRSAGPGGGGFSPGPVRSRHSSMVPQNSNHNSYGNIHHQQQQHTHGTVSGMGNPSMVMPIGGSVSTSPTSGVTVVTNTSYLSPPLDSSWRRTHSDSALHEATLAQDSTNRRGQVEMTFQNACDANQSSLSVAIGTDGRPKSCCDVSRVPGIK